MGSGFLDVFYFIRLFVAELSLEGMRAWISVSVANKIERV